MKSRKGKRERGREGERQVEERNNMEGSTDREKEKVKRGGERESIQVINYLSSC